MSFIVEELTQIVGENGVLLESDICGRQEQIWSSKFVEAQALVRPRTTEEVSEILRYCHATEQAVIVHGGLTGMAYGASTQPRDLVLSTELLNTIERVDTTNRSMTVQAGVKLQQVQETAQSNQLLFTLDLGARGSCSIGGNIATNAGGNQVIRYGMTRDMVLGLEAVLADGTVVSSMNDMIKNNAGYDLKHLFIGTEGTLGVITRAVLRLREEPLSTECALLAVEEFDQLAQILKNMDRRLGGTLSSFEVMWNNYFSHITSLPGYPPPLPSHYPYYALIEARGGDQEHDRQRMEAALAHVYEANLAADIVVAQNQAQRDAFWGIRDAVEHTVIDQPTYVFDVSLRIRDMEAYVAAVEHNLREHFSTLHLFTFGHLGDGNLHFNIHVGTDPSHKHLVDRCVYEPLGPINGSISAEHGIGLEKKEFLYLSRNEAEVQLMRRLKEMLDPKGILNSGRIFD